MCGLAGILGPEASTERGRQMRDRQSHRGPHARGLWTGEHVVLGHSRLRVIDLTEAGDQPIWTPDGRRGLVYNGEVYNYRELRGRLEDRGHDIRTRTDSEVVLHAWAEWGPGALERFRGMFAFALWDRLKKRLVLARDRVGVKPLYWHRTAEGTLSFASEVRALLASGLAPRRLDRAVLPQFLAQQTAPSPRTLVEGVRMLEPGSWMSVKLEGGRAPPPRIRRYWHPLEEARERRAARSAEPSEDAMVEAIRGRLEVAVERRLISDAPLGAFLSGGLDSTAVVAFMAQLRDSPVRTFTVVFEDDGYRDGAYARLAADRFGTDHEEVRLGEDDLLERIPSAVADQDHPSGDGVNTWIVAQAASDAGLTVALSGLGGDELFGGYPSFRHWKTLRRAEAAFSLPAPVRRVAAALLRRLPASVRSEKLAELVETKGTLPEVYPVLRRVYGPDWRTRLLGDRAGRADSAPGIAESLARVFERTPPTSPLAGISYAEMANYMHDVLLRDTDQMSMAHSLEVRVPLLDHELVEYVLSLPDRVRRPENPPKRYLAKATRDRLPEAVATRPKSGFHMPFDKWMRGPLRQFCEEGISAVADSDAFSGSGARRVWTRFLDGDRALTWSRPWLLVALGRWLGRESLT